MDSSSERRSASSSIASEGVLLELKIPKYEGDTLSGYRSCWTYGILGRKKTSQGLDGVTRTTRSITLSALETTDSGLETGDVLSLVRDALVIVGSAKLLVLDPGAVDPAGEPILFRAVCDAGGDA